MDKRVVLLFPGQGSQVVGMGKDLFEGSELARSIFEAADERLGMRLSALMFEGPDEELVRTSICQPALYLHGYICLQLLREKRPNLVISGAAGLSLGEFTAHASAGSFAFEDGLELVAKRGCFMEKAAAESSGTMAVMNGCGRADIEKLIEGAGVQIANYNTPAQFVISGPVDAVGEVVAKADRDKVCATGLLSVSGAFHSRLMESARDALSSELAGIELSDPRFPVVSNVTARPVREAGKIRSTLEAQVTSSVRWSDSMRWFVEQGEACFVQPGPGKTLVGLMRRINRDTRVLPVGDFSTLTKALSALD